VPLLVHNKVNTVLGLGLLFQSISSGMLIQPVVSVAKKNMIIFFINGHELEHCFK
jgi:hypothetical protein